MSFFDNIKFNISEEDHFLISNYWIEKIRKMRESFKISFLLPPPNITGDLHVGHAINAIFHDFWIRYFKILGKDSFCIYGVDHAGISLQKKAEEEFFFDKKMSYNEKENWVLKNWYPRSLSNFSKKWEKIGFLIDYKNPPFFTFDCHAKEIVKSAFINLYNKKFIYHGKKVVSWDPSLKTFISDIEIEHKITDEKLYYIKYFLSDKNDDYLLVATSRPETIFVDVALFVNPRDSRYLKFIGKKVRNIWNGEEIPVLADDQVKIEFGTGILKCTPAHSLIDFDLAKKHNLSFFSACDSNGLLNSRAGKWEKREIFSIREEFVEYLIKNNFCEKYEFYKAFTPFSKKSGSKIEPILSDQWFLDFPKLIKYVEKKSPDVLSSLSFFPEKFKIDLDVWKNNSKEWCISRQSWWGHKIPAWHNKFSKEIYVGRELPIDYLKEDWLEENDVLDTWFSSSLWPIITSLKNNNLFNEKFEILREMENFYPISFLITAYDIIFFWVLKMIFLCFYFSGKVPFNKVIFHGIVRDENGKKMSKSLGNGMDPELIINKYGSDSLRIFALNNNLGSDYFFHESKFINGWRICQKIWSIANYINKKIDKKIIIDENLIIENFLSEKSNQEKNNYFEDLINDWMIFKIIKLQEKFLLLGNNNWNANVFVDEIIYFIKENFSIKYLDSLKKIEFFSSKKKKNKLTDHIIFYVYYQILIMFHSISPFITDHIIAHFWKKSALDCSFKPLFKDLNYLLFTDKNKIKNTKKVDFLFYLIKELNHVEKKIVNKNIYFEPDFYLLEECWNKEEDFFILFFLSHNNLVNFNFSRDKKDNFSSSYLLGIYGKIWYEDSFYKKNIVNINDKLDYFLKEYKRSKDKIDNDDFVKKAPQFLVEKEKKKEEYFKKEIKNIKKELGKKLKK